ncbi:MAG TPA: SgcJ/EcaC family oxidoreductase [Opitutaceae bacterium]|nr:SgcJ/EcaC family oxidoreductase [Opitutaceae bacterium]
MKTKLLLAVLSLWFAAPMIGAEPPADDSVISQIVADQVKAWNIGDAKAFSERFADDGSFTNIRGTAFYGHRAFEDRHAEVFATVFKGSKLAMSVDKIRYVRPDVAIVDISTEVSQVQGTLPGVRAASDGKFHTRLQEVLVKEPDGWKIASYHNVDVKQ